MAGGEPVGRKAVMAGSVGHDRDGERRAVALGADQHAFHRAFLRGGDTPRQGKTRRVEVPRQRRTHGCTANQKGKRAPRTHIEIEPDGIPYLVMRQSTSTVLMASPGGWRRTVRCSL